MRITHLLGIALLLIATVAQAAPPQGKGMGHKGMHTLQPMPNLMRVIMQHGDKLNLSKEQAEKLATWRKANGPRVHARMKAMATVRKVLQDAVLRGANIAAVNVHLSHMDRVRAEIVAAKVACRDNMRQILSDEQWELATELYRQHYM